MLYKLELAVHVVLAVNIDLINRNWKPVYILAPHKAEHLFVSNVGQSKKNSSFK